MWKEAAMAYMTYHPSAYVERLRKLTENLCLMDTGSSGRTLNPKYIA
jgi:hypothetical protein